MEARLVDDVPLTSPHPLALGPGFILYFWMSESSERTWSPGDCEGPGTHTKERIAAPSPAQQAWGGSHQGVLSWVVGWREQALSQKIRDTVLVKGIVCLLRNV